MNLSVPIKFGNKKEYLRPCSETEALAALELAAAKIVKHARWCNFSRSKINELRRPLLQLRLARRKGGRS